MHPKHTLPAPAAQPELRSPEPQRQNLHRHVRELGYHGVLPLMPAEAKLAAGANGVPGKSPGRRLSDGSWGGLYGWPSIVATTENLDTWGSWGAGVGLRPGDDVLVFDIDDRNEKHADRIEEIIAEETGTTTAPCCIGQFPKRKLIFRLSKSRRSQVVSYDDGMVELRTGTSQVALHGTHPKTRQPYYWPRPLCRKDDLTVVGEEQIAKIVARLEHEMPNAGVVGAGTASRGARDPETLKAGNLTALVKAMDALPNDSTADRPTWVRRAHALRAATLDLPALGLELWERHSEKYPNNDPDETTRLWETIRPENGLAVGFQDLMRWADQTSGGKFSLVRDYWFEKLPGLENESARPEGRIVLTPYAYRAPHLIPPRQWIFAGHFLRKFVSVTVAPGGTGKSANALIEAIAMALGRKLLHHQPHGRSRVWVFNGEDPLEEIERRVAAILLAYQIDPAELEGWLFIDSGRRRRMVLASETRDGVTIHTPVFDALHEGIREHRIDVVIIDPFISSHRVVENGNNQIDMVVKELGALAERDNVAIELIHHVRKLNGAEVTVEDARGAGSLVDAARSARTLTKMTSDEGKRFGVENHRRYIRVGGDPKSNMTAPPATEETNWMELRSVSLGNATAEYPNGDSVGVLFAFKPVKTIEEVKDDETNRERLIVARAVLEATNGEIEIEVSRILPDVMHALHQAGVTRSTAEHITRQKIVAALAVRDGFVLDRNGQSVRLKAEQTKPGHRSPWTISLSLVDANEGASGANGGVLA